MIQDRSPGRNWAGNYTYRAQKLHRPSTIEQLQEIIANAPRVRVLGSRHSFNDIADSSEIITLEAMPMDVVVDYAADTVSFNAALKYGELVHTLNEEGVALHNLASLPHISVAGAVATATHGSGDRIGNLATAVAGLELITSSGEIVTVRRGDPGAARRRAGLRGPPGRLRGSHLGRAARAPRRGVRERVRRQRLHALGP